MLGKPGQDGEKHHNAKLKNAQVKKWRKEYERVNFRYGYLTLMYKRDKPPVTYNAFNVAIVGRSGLRPTWLPVI